MNFDIEISKYHKQLYKESVKDFFVRISMTFRKEKEFDKNMTDPVMKDHRHWLAATAQGREELKKLKEQATERRHQDYLESVGRRTNAFSNQERAKVGLPSRPFRPHIAK